MHSSCNCNTDPFYFAPIFLIITAKEEKPGLYHSIEIIAAMMFRAQTDVQIFDKYPYLQTQF